MPEHIDPRFGRDRNERSVLDTSKARNQRCFNTGLGASRCLLFCVLCLCVALSNAATKAPPVSPPPREQIEVLIISSSDPDLPDVAAMVEQTETHILEGSNKPVHFSFEYIESSASLAEPARERAMASYLVQKYHGQTFDLVIAIDEETVAFSEKIRAQLFPDAALLFFVTDPENSSSWLDPKVGRTGVVRKLNFLATLELALRQNPGTSHVVVVSGSSDGEKRAARIAHDQFRKYESNLEFEYLTDLQFSDLGPRLANVQPDSIIIFLDFVTDSHGQQFIPARILPALSRSANRPIYGTFSSVVGAGAVGGSVADLSEVGRILGNDGLRILKGDKAEKIPVAMGDYQHYVIDWRQLHRWGIPEARLPKESEVRYWEYSPWELYRWRILGILAVVLVESLLIVLLLGNIARRKQAESALRESAAREQARAKELETVLDAVPMPVRIAHDDACRWMTGNRAAHEQARVPVGQNFSSSAPPGERPHYRLMEDGTWVTADSLPMQRAAATGRPVFGRALTVVYEDGSERETVENAVPLLDEAGKPRGAVGTSIDVTDLKQAERALRESELRFRTVFERSPVGIALVDSRTGQTLQVNPKFCEISGRGVDELLGIDFRSITHPGEIAEYGEPRQQLVEQKATSYEVEEKYARPDGSERWVRILVVPLWVEGETRRWQMALVEDITERKAAEEARFRLAAIVESSDDAIISKNLDGIIVSWNRGAEHIFGYTTAEAVGQPILIIVPPDFVEEEKTLLQKTRTGGRIEHYETVRLTKQGKKINVSLTMSPVKDVTDKIVGVSKIAHDITERKRVQEELQKSEERFSKAFRQSPMALSLVSARTHRYLDINKTFERTWGYSRSDVIGKSAVELGLWVNPSERTRLTQKLESQGFLREVECEWRTKDGRTLIALASVELTDIGGEPCFLGVFADITDRKRAQQAVLESEKRFRLLANTAPVLIWMSGPDKLCNYFNEPWLEFTGRRLEEELGNGWAKSVHSEDLQKCLDTYTQSFDRKEKFGMEYRLRRHDGEYRWVLDIGVPRFNSDTSFAGYVGCCMDISDLKQARATVIEFSSRLLQAGEEERARIARELHDDINQRLALLANGLQEAEQAASSNKDRPQKENLHDLWQMTNAIATDIQHMSHQLHPSKLQYLGLATTLRDLCHEFAQQHKIAVECVAKGLPDDLQENVSLNLFRTVQESLRNAAKHSQARHVRVELTCESNVVHLRVSDDGVGFDPDDARIHHGLGMVSMRERLRSVGGEFSIWSKPSLGTLVEGWVPATRKLVPSAAESVAD